MFSIITIWTCWRNQSNNNIIFALINYVALRGGLVKKWYSNIEEDWEEEVSSPPGLKLKLSELRLEELELEELPGILQ